MKKVNETNFINEVKDGIVLVDFYADWCGPCKMLSPILEKIGKENENLKIVKVNIDESQMLASYFSVFSIPTLILIKDGKPLEKIVGFNPKETIEQFIARAK